MKKHCEKCNCLSNAENCEHVVQSMTLQHKECKAQGHKKEHV